ncbi:MAG: 5-methyltetrahydropteroyltriglutamate--homocysteine S-methyltransferase, partial [Acidimicrobiia bacterium]
MAKPTFLPHLVGYPRIGPNRELKRALEGRWSRRITADEFQTTVAALRADHLAEQRDLVGAATDDFFLYDQTLETTLMLGLVPEWAQTEDAFDTLSGLARGTPEHEAWEMTKWFDTNYHFVVPELDHGPPQFEVLAWREPVDGTTWVVLGPYSLAKLARVNGALHLTAAQAAQALWEWLTNRGAGSRFEVQLDEPCLGLTGDFDPALFHSAYRDVPSDLNALVSVQFGRATPKVARWLADHGLTVQIPGDHLEDYEEAIRGRERSLISVMDGRSVWPDDPDAVAEEVLNKPALDGQTVFLAPSTSLMFLPYTVEGEELPAGFQFAREKAAKLRAWADAFGRGKKPSFTPVQVPEFPTPGEQYHRANRHVRREAQSDLNLPRLPTTTTGSLPQTAAVRRLRGRYQRGELDQAGYEAEIDELIKQAIEWQENIGLDVLVHGEFERSDMVEYFAEHMDGFLRTRHGWVVSYGSRCTRPPILAAPPTITFPMTVRAWKVAQEASSKPVKGMLTGPVTIVNWSYR